ncbi:hypothetical protein LJK88_02340 [Paenibacillus sp. P26]|nr:hypothetical protein LJK88_02340 [Paenibacillus sp. P26]
MPSRKKDPATPTETAPADSAGTTQDSAENKVVPLETKPARRRVKAAPSTAEAADEPAAPKKPRRTRTAAAKKPAKQAPPEAEAPQAETAHAEAAAAAVSETEPEAAIAAAPDSLPLLLESKLKKKERNETHDKDRVFIRKDLKERLEALAARRGKGFKTLLLNYGLEKALDELEQMGASPEESP